MHYNWSLICSSYPTIDIRWIKQKDAMKKDDGLVCVIYALCLNIVMLNVVGQSLANNKLLH